METCHVTNQLNAYLDDVDREEMLAEYRYDIEMQIEEATVQKLIRCINLNHMDSFKELCEEFYQDFDTIMSLSMKAEQEMFCGVYILHQFTDGEAETMARIAAKHFDYESAIDAEIERRDMAAGEPNE